MAEAIPGHYSQEKNKALGLIAGGAFTSLFILFHMIQLAPIVAFMIIVDLTKDNWQVVENAMSSFYNLSVTFGGISYAYKLDPVITVTVTAVFVLISLIPLILALALNPYRTYDLIHGDARRGNMSDVHEMEDRKQVGIKGGKYLHLGLWPSTGEPMRLIETLSCLVLAPPGTGKSLAPHEPVLMFDGTIKKTGDLKVGDLLMGPDSRPRMVLNTNPGKGMMYRVIPSVGRPFECNGDHILSLRAKRKPFLGIRRKDRICFVTVNQWIEWDQERKSEWHQWRAAVDFTHEIELPVDAYDAGYALLDAVKGDVSNPFVPEEIASEERVVSGSGKTGRSLSEKRWDPYIPYAYRTSSRANRQRLLAGVIDRAARYNPAKKSYDLYTSNRQIAEHLCFIARSLGIVVKQYPQDGRCDALPKASFKLSFEGSIHQIPSRKYTANHDCTSKGQGATCTMTDFRIEEIGHGEYFGIIVDGDHQYLLDDFTVTHNTATFVVPSILDTPESSFIVNDPKPELFDLTSGYRAQIGHVFMINWSATDKVDPMNLEDPEKTIFYPRFNPLSPKLLPPAGTAERDTYLDAVANVMSPGSGKGGNSDYFEQKGRAALVGFLHYICSKVADAEQGQMDLENIPTEWHGEDMEPSIPMLIDMINEGLRNASKKNDEEKEAAAQEGRFYQGDALSDWLKNIVKECAEKKYNPRALTEITPLVSMAPNERSGILGTMDKAFLPFKNAAVRERTRSCDFVPSDLRGMPDENGVMRPVTLYVCVNQAEAAAFATITSLLYEILSREYLAYGPGEVNRNGIKLGPYPVCFMLDEFAKLPKIEAVMTGPDLGRSKKTMYCLVAQSDSQIGKLYSKEDQQIIYATTAVKYILPQNDKDTIKLVQDMVGPTTIRRSSRSKTKGGDLKEWGKSNESTNLEKVDFIRPGDISGMKPGTHIIMAQGFMNRPYFMKSVFFFKEPEMLAKAFNPRTGKGPKPSYPVPETVRQARIEEWKRKHRNQLKNSADQKIVVNLEKYETEEPITV